MNNTSYVSFSLFLAFFSTKFQIHIPFIYHFYSHVFLISLILTCDTLSIVYSSSGPFSKTYVFVNAKNFDKEAENFPSETMVDVGKNVTNSECSFLKWISWCANSNATNHVPISQQVRWNRFYWRCITKWQTKNGQYRRKFWTGVGNFSFESSIDPKTCIKWTWYCVKKLGTYHVGFGFKTI